MKLDNFIFILCCLILFCAAVSGIRVSKEGLTNNDVINYNNAEYSHTVNLPLNDITSCSNFCGPKSQCSISKQQCTSDIDCDGCNPGPTKRPKCITKEVIGYNDNVFGLNYNPLTTGYNGYNTNFSEIYDKSKYAQIKKPYEGINTWKDSFNKGIELYNKKSEANDEYNSTMDFRYQSKQKYYEPKYPMRISATGTFYETTPPAFNSDLNV